MEDCMLASEARKMAIQIHDEKLKRVKSQISDKIKSEASAGRRNYTTNIESPIIMQDVYEWLWNLGYDVSTYGNSKLVIRW